MLILFFFAFLAGIVTILSPCILPVLPIVLSASITGSKKKPLGIIAGFILSFTFFTLFLATLAKISGISADALRIFSIVVIFFFGLTLLIPAFQTEMERLFSKLSAITPQSKPDTGFLGGVLLGISLGLLWTPCVGPIIASVITLAATSTVTTTTFLITFFYSLGTAIPMLGILYGGRNLLQKNKWLLKKSSLIQKTFGVLMILIAIGIFFNIDRTFQTYILTTFPQYGTGLTKIEDNSIVKNQLDTLKNNSSTSSLSENAPELIPGGEWFNTKPLTLKQLRGKVVLIDFWTYTCINCIRTLPYIQRWYETYKDKGLVVIGVHTPEFAFEHNAANVRKAIADFHITYPVMQDNNYATWNAYQNEYWPAKYFIDKNGKIRSTHFGEGDYDESEKTIQDLLKETGITQALPTPNNPEYTVEAQSPETYLGNTRMQYLSSPELVTPNTSMHFSKPLIIPNNTFAYDGNYVVGDEYAMPEKGAKLHLSFTAKNVYLVMRSNEPMRKVHVLLDGKEIGKDVSGDDVKDGIVTVSDDRLYSLVSLKSAEHHTLTLEFLDPMIQLYAFTFG